MPSHGIRYCGRHHVLTARVSPGSLIYVNPPFPPAHNMNNCFHGNAAKPVRAPVAAEKASLPLPMMEGATKHADPLRALSCAGRLDCMRCPMPAGGELQRAVAGDDICGFPPNRSILNRPSPPPG